MSRIRTIKPQWLTDERLRGASDEARLLSVALITLADDHGNGVGGELVLAGAVWGSQKSSEALAKTSRAFRELLAIGFAEQYFVEGQPYWRIRNWKKHQRIDKPSRPKVPTPERADSVKENGLANSSRKSSEGLEKKCRLEREGEREREREERDPAGLAGLKPAASFAHSYEREKNGEAGLTAAGAARQASRELEPPAPKRSADEAQEPTAAAEITAAADSPPSESEPQPSEPKSESDAKRKHRARRKQARKELSAFLAWFNRKNDRRFREREQLVVWVQQLLTKGYKQADLRCVAEAKRVEWQNDDRMQKNIRPSTLLRPSNFERYVDEAREIYEKQQAALGLTVNWDSIELPDDDESSERDGDEREAAEAVVFNLEEVLRMASTDASE